MTGQINNPGVFQRTRNRQSITLREALPSFTIDTPGIDDSEDLADILSSGVKVENHRDFSSPQLSKMIAQELDGSKVAVNLDGSKVAETTLKTRDISVSGFTFITQSFKNANKPIRNIMKREFRPGNSDLHNLRDYFKVNNRL